LPNIKGKITIFTPKIPIGNLKIIIDNISLFHHSISQTEHKPVPEGNAHPANPSPFRGGDFRQPGPGSQAHVAVAGEGTGQNNEKAVAIQAVLCALIGESGWWN
jgi:hypothetical protein